MNDSVSIHLMLIDREARLRAWLINNAIPVWTKAGFDRKQLLFHDTLSRSFSPKTGASYRSFVQHRQIYSVAEAQLLGSSEGVELVSDLVYSSMVRNFVHDEGFWLHKVDGSTCPSAIHYDLYDQAFAIFGGAIFARANPDKKDEFESQAARLIERMTARCGADNFGYAEIDERIDLRRSNPHMHLLEAVLEWERLCPDSQWASIADQIVVLAINHFIDSDLGIIREYFDHQWRPYPGQRGRQIEPGHHFEWAWLLQRWALSRNNNSVSIIARQLFKSAYTYGICRKRHVAVLELNDDFSPRQSMARLWSQTEWLKASLIFAALSDRDEKSAFEKSALQAIDAIELYFRDMPDGLWRDKLLDDGSFVDEDSPASSLYHITCAISELSNYVARSV